MVACFPWPEEGQFVCHFVRPGDLHFAKKNKVARPFNAENGKKSDFFLRFGKETGTEQIYSFYKFSF